MMDIKQILQRFDEERRTLVRDSEIIDIQPSITRLQRSTQHEILYSSLNIDNTDRVIDEQIQHFAKITREFEWKYYTHDQPANLLDRLLKHGFTAGPREAVLVFDLSAHSSWIQQPHGDCTVVRMTDQYQIADFRRVAEEVFAKDFQLTSDELARALQSGSTDHYGYVAYVNDRPVSVGRLYTHPKSHFAGLYGGGTLQAFRGQGIYRAMLAARAKDAIRLGAKYLQVDALPTSEPILKRLGFEHITYTYPLVYAFT